MLFKSPVLGLVGTGEDFSTSQRKLEIFHFLEGRSLADPPLTFVTSVLAVKFNKNTMVVVLETKIHILSMNTLKPVGEPIDTTPNPNGECLTYLLD
jgi:autophagy-related protein 18